MPEETQNQENTQPQVEKEVCNECKDEFVKGEKHECKKEVKTEAKALTPEEIEAIVEKKVAEKLANIPIFKAQETGDPTLSNKKVDKAQEIMDKGQLPIIGGN